MMEKDETTLEDDPLAKSSQQNDKKYHLYPERWWILVIVILLNLGNNSHWIAFPTVNKSVALHYDQSGEKMDLIPTVSYGLGIIFVVVATYVMEKFDLKLGLHIGGHLTGLGGLLCCLSTLPLLSEEFNSEFKFWLALLGQALSGIAVPFISCVPTKISQNWFNDKERTLATILASTSQILGTVFGLLFTPFIVQDQSDVPIMNIVWFVPAGIGSILTIWKVRSSYPPTPPSLSAELAIEHRSREGFQYWSNIKKLFTNRPFIIFVFFMGAAMGYLNTLTSKLSQILCSRGYTDQLAGLGGSLILLMGFVASFPMSMIAYKTKKPTLVVKLCTGIALGFVILLSYFLRLPDHSGAIIANCAFFGIFGVGIYPICLELVTECTYPINEVLGTSFLSLSSALQGVILMIAENHLGSDLSEEELKIQKCVENFDDWEQGHQKPQDYFNYLITITVYIIVMSAPMLLFFNTEMNRSNADKENLLEKKNENELQIEPKSAEENETQILNKKELHIEPKSEDKLLTEPNEVEIVNEFKLNQIE